MRRAERKDSNKNRMNIEGKRGEYKAKKGGEDERRKRKGEQKRTEKGGGF